MMTIQTNHIGCNTTVIACSKPKQNLFVFMNYQGVFFSHSGSKPDVDAATFK